MPLQRNVGRTGHHNARTQSGVAARPQGPLLSVRQDVRPNSRRTGLAAVSPSVTLSALRKNRIPPRPHFVASGARRRRGPFRPLSQSKRYFIRQHPHFRPEHAGSGNVRLNAGGSIPFARVDLLLPGPDVKPGASHDQYSSANEILIVAPGDFCRFNRCYAPYRQL